MESALVRKKIVSPVPPDLRVKQVEVVLPHPEHFHEFIAEKHILLANVF